MTPAVFRVEDVKESPVQTAEGKFRGREELGLGHVRGLREDAPGSPVVVVVEEVDGGDVHRI